MTPEIIPSGAALGAEIRGVNLTEPLDDATKDTIIDAYHQHQAVFFRDQNLTDRQLISFSGIFGEVIADHRPKNYHPELDTDVPDLVDVVSNVSVDGISIGALGSGEAIWHSDTVPLPNAALILHALEIPTQSTSDTRIANTQAAFAAMPEKMRQRLEGRVLIHGRQDYSLVKEDGGPEIDPSQSPGPWFPLVRTHIATGKKGLFLGRRGDCYIVDMDVAESNALLEEIWNHVTQPEFVWSHQWSVGDVLVWDNRCTVHSRGAISEGRRRLHRTTTAGEWPR